MNDKCWERILKLFRRAIICPQCGGKDVDYLGCFLEGVFVSFRCNKCRHDYYPKTKDIAERRALHIRLWGAQIICGVCEGENSYCPILKEETVLVH